jgi:hypothetical protein
MSDTFTQYRRTQIAEMQPWTPDFDMSGVSVSAVDAADGSPKTGDMIARNPKNHADKWLVAADYFADNFEPLRVAVPPNIWRPISTKPNFTACEERGVYRDNGDGLFFFKATHWRPLPQT